MKLPSRIPTLIGILLLILVVGLVVFFTENAFRSPSKASGSQEPKNTKVTNLSDATFTVSWMTERPTTGTLLVATNGKTSTVYYDERDTTGKLTAYTSHSITVRDAHPNTLYSATPLINGKPYITTDKPIEIHTFSTLPLNTGGLEPAYGILKTPDGAPASDALIYLSLDGGQDFSTIAKPSGSWLIPLNQARTIDGTSFLPILERMNESIQIYTASDMTTIVTDTLNDSPVPEVILGKEYDFRRQQAKTSGGTSIALRPIATATPSPKIELASLPIGGSVLGDETLKNFTVSLSAPKNGSALTTTLPLIQGTGIPGKFVGLSIGMNNVTHGSIQVQSNGLWSFTPTKALAPGKQSVTMSTVDATGKSVAITHVFEIFKSGTQVLGDATPSATLTIAPTTGTITATPVTTETIASTLSAEPIPTSGNELPTIMLLILGLGLAAGGMILTAHSY